MLERSTIMTFWRLEKKLKSGFQFECHISSLSTNLTQFYHFLSLFFCLIILSKLIKQVGYKIFSNKHKNTSVLVHYGFNIEIFTVISEAQIQSCQSFLSTSLLYSNSWHTDLILEAYISINHFFNKMRTELWFQSATVLLIRGGHLLRLHRNQSHTVHG